MIGENELSQIAGPADRSFRKLLGTIKDGFGLNTGARRIKKRGEAQLSVLKQFDSTVQNSEWLEGAAIELNGMIFK